MYEFFNAFVQQLKGPLTMLFQYVWSFGKMCDPWKFGKLVLLNLYQKLHITLAHTHIEDRLLKTIMMKWQDAKISKRAYHIGDFNQYKENM